MPRPSVLASFLGLVFFLMVAVMAFLVDTKFSFLCASGRLFLKRRLVAAFPSRHWTPPRPMVPSEFVHLAAFFVWHCSAPLSVYFFFGWRDSSFFRPRSVAACDCLYPTFFTRIVSCLFDFFSTSSLELLHFWPSGRSCHRVDTLRVLPLETPALFPFCTIGCLSPLDFTQLGQSVFLFDDPQQCPLTFPLPTPSPKSSMRVLYPSLPNPGGFGRSHSFQSLGGDYLPHLKAPSKPSCCATAFCLPSFHILVLGSGVNPEGVSLLFPTLLLFFLYVEETPFPPRRR